MRRCLELARLASGNTAPNPMVGAVIVHEGKIIGEGYHHNFGGAHAETNAIDSVKNRGLLKDSTMYVNLEPCAHWGHTPPCSERIVSEGIPRVVIGTRDPSAKVGGKGIEIMKKGGCTVKENILNQECRRINHRFFTFHEKKRPYIIVKWAQTIDGYIDKLRDKDDPIQPNWITNDLSKRLVHKWRSEEQSILVGSNTALKDDPSLNVREWHGKNPLRLVIDRPLEVHEELKLVRDDYPIVVFTDSKSSPENEKNLEKQGVDVVRLDFSGNVLEQIAEYLYQQNIMSLFVEGGKYTITHFIDANFWDEARVFIGNKMFHSGVKAPKMPDRKIAQQEELLETQLYVFHNKG